MRLLDFDTSTISLEMQAAALQTSVMAKQEQGATQEEASAAALQERCNEETRAQQAASEAASLADQAERQHTSNLVCSCTTCSAFCSIMMCQVAYIAQHS